MKPRRFIPSIFLFFICLSFRMKVETISFQDLGVMPSWVLGNGAERASTIDGLDLNALGLDLSRRCQDEQPDGPLRTAASIFHSVVSCHLFLGSKNAATCPLPSGQTAPFGSMQGAAVLARNGRS